MKALRIKKLHFFILSLIITSSCFAQTAPWYVGAFSAADGSKLLITESRVYSWPAHGNGFILGNYTPDDVFLDSEGGGIAVWSGCSSPFGDPGLAELELTANKTIIDFETVYKKNPNLLTSLRNEAKKLDLKEEEKAVMYTKYIESKKWLQGVWVRLSESNTVESPTSYLFIFPQGLFYLDQDLEDGKVWQLESLAEKENADFNRSPVVENDNARTVILGGTVTVDTSAKTVKIYDDVYRKVLP